MRPDEELDNAPRMQSKHRAELVPPRVSQSTEEENIYSSKLDRAVPDFQQVSRAEVLNV
jgi:hypothetical protein